MFHCDRCSFVAKNKGGLTTHKKIHIEDDYNQLVQRNHEIELMYDVLSKFDPSIRESKVILDLAYKVDKLEEHIISIEKSKEKMIETEEDLVFNSQGLHIIMTFNTEFMILSKVEVGGRDMSHLSNNNEIYGWPDVLKHTVGGLETHVIGAGFPTTKIVSDQNTKELKVRFRLYPKSTTQKRYPQYLNNFTECYINNRKIFLPFAQSLNYYGQNDLNRLINLVYINSMCLVQV